LGIDDGCGQRGVSLRLPRVEVASRSRVPGPLPRGDPLLALHQIHGDPGLRRCGDRLEPLQDIELVHPLRVVGRRVDSRQRRQQTVQIC
jgi:hypothetical protein